MTHLFETINTLCTFYIQAANSEKLEKWTAIMAGGLVDQVVGPPILLIVGFSMTFILQKVIG